MAFKVFAFNGRDNGADFSFGGSIDSANRRMLRSVGHLCNGGQNTGEK